MFCTVLWSFLGGRDGPTQMRMRRFRLARMLFTGSFAIAWSKYRALGPFFPFCTAVHRGKRIWPDTYWPDAAPRRDFRNLWFAATRSDTGIAGVGF